MDPTDISDPGIERLHATALAAHFAARRPPQASRDGRCRDCGDPIPPARIAAVPDAARCTTCQAVAERGRGA